jgi:hypothetical protein
MRKFNYVIAFVFLLLLINISCGSTGTVGEQEYPPTQGDPEKLEEALSSREQTDPPPLTLLQAYQIAQGRATEWNENSFLGDMGGSLENNLYYTFYFYLYNPSKGIQCEKRRTDYEHLKVNIDRISGEIREASSGFGVSPLGRIDPNPWLIDSPQAMEIADENGGNSFIEKFPDCRIGISADGIVKGWQVNYREALPSNGENGAWLQIEVDPFTGEATITEDTGGIT